MTGQVVFHDDDVMVMKGDDHHWAVTEEVEGVWSPLVANSVVALGLNGS